MHNKDSEIFLAFVFLLMLVSYMQTMECDDYTNTLYYPLFLLPTSASLFLLRGIRSETFQSGSKEVGPEALGLDVVTRP